MYCDTGIARGNKGTSDSCYPLDVPCPPGTTPVGWWHTHGAYDPEYGSGNENFSHADKNISNDGHGPGFVATPNGWIKEYIPPPQFWQGTVNVIGRVRSHDN